MTQEDLIRDLGTIGSSGTAAFRAALGASDVVAAKSLIGQFGVGFLSAYRVSVEISISSRRWESGSKPVTFRSRIDGKFEVAQTDADLP